MPREKRPHGRQRPGRAPANPFTRASTPVEVIIERIGARGDGVAEAEIQIGWRRRRTPLFVPYTLPGERVVARPVAERGEGVACEPMELLDLAPERVDPPCAHFMSCGGCALQHMAEPAYQAWKRELVVIALRRSTLAEVPVGDLVPCLPGTRRRADFVLQRLGARTVAGFHERGSNRIADLRHCPVLHPDLEALLGALRLAIGPLLEAGDRIAAVANRLDNGIDLQLELPREPDLAMREELAAFADTVDLARLTYILAGDADRAATPVAMRHPATMRFGAVDVAVPPAAFLQATVDGEAAIASAVLEAVGDAARVADLYAGVGTLSVRLAARAAVTAMDGDGAAVRALGEAAAASGLAGRLTAEERDLAQRPIEPADLAGFDAVVMDPPRAGARTQAERLAASGVPLVVMVSCNPATFARDARILVEGGYQAGPVTPIDQFLWSPHVELVGAFRRA
jgi:23S rRNA (uracil1939-C5)-methyltransferase